MVLYSKKSILKKVTAFLLAVIMAFSVQPYHMTVLAAEGEYTFTITESITTPGTKTPVKAAELKVYADEATLTTGGTPLFTGTVDETNTTGVVTIDSATSATISAGCIYVITAADYTTVQGEIEDGKWDYAHDLVADAAVEPTPSIQYQFTVTESIATSGIPTAVAGAKVTLYKDAEALAAGNVITAETNENGVVLFDIATSESIQVGYIYVIEAANYKTVQGTIEENTYAYTQDLVNYVSVSGTVKDAEGNPVANATVKIFNETDTTTPALTDVMTDANGQYTFTPLALNTNYLISISAVDYKRLENKAVSMVTSDVVVEDIILESNPSVQMAFASEKVDVYFGNEFANALTVDEAYLAETGAGVTYSCRTEDVNVVTVDEATGAVEMKSTGTVIITATAARTANYKETSVSYTLVVSAKETNKDFVFVNDAGETVTIGTKNYKDEPFTIKTSFSDEPEITGITYSSNNSSVADIDENTGEVTIGNAGEAVITAVLPEGHDYALTTITYTLTVAKIEPEVVFTNTSITAYAGNTADETPQNTLQINTQEYEDGNPTIEYSSSDSSIALIDENTGIVTPGIEGTATITVTTGDTANYRGVIRTYTVVVKEKQTNDKFTFNGVLNKENVTKTYGDADFTYEAYLEGGTGTEKITYTLDDAGGAKVVEVDSNGKVTIKQAGNAVIYATLEEGYDYAKTTICYYLTVNPDEAEIQFTADGISDGSTIKTVYGTPIFTVGAKIVEGEGEVDDIAFSSDASDVASVDEDGNVTIKKSGTAVITATLPASNNYNAVSISYTVEVDRATQVIAFAQSSYEHINGSTFTSPKVVNTGAADATGKITYSIVESGQNVATIDPNTGELSLTLNTGTITVKAVKPTDERYNQAECIYTLTVKDWVLDTTSQTNYYDITGTSHDAANWFSEFDSSNPIKIVAKSGYSLFAEKPVVGAVPVSEISLTDVVDGKENQISFYIKDNANGYISNIITAQGIQVDTIAPKTEVKVTDATIWDKIAAYLTFNLIGQKNPVLSISVSDNASGIKSVQYYIQDGTEVEKDYTVVETNANWVKYTEALDMVKYDLDGKVVYFKVLDHAGHVTYTSTRGLIYDGSKPEIVSSILATPTNDIFDKDVDITFSATDIAANTGLKEVSYIVKSNDSITQEGILYSYDAKNTNLITKWSSAANSKDIKVDADLNEGNNVVVTIRSVDNIGNVGEKVIPLRIDKTAPAITVLYDNNTVNAQSGDISYFAANRTATIQIRENNFDPEQVKMDITSTDGVLPEISEWIGSKDGEDYIYTATVSYVADGDYTFAISCTDKAGNENSPVEYGTSVATNAFTIDKTIPTATIAYDNNTALNTNYYAADRTATITITEHNFDVSKIELLINASDDGTAIAAPGVSWSSVGDTHTAQVVFNTDGRYEVSMTGADILGNALQPLEQEVFYVDKTNPTLAIANIVDQSANNMEQIGFTITATDTNFDVFTTEVTATIRTENGFETRAVDLGSLSDINNGQVYTVSNIETDGIYSIMCTVVDKAGNEFTEVVLERADGGSYTESKTAVDTLLTFSVNRDGSVFDFNDDTREILERYYVQNVDEDLVIYEINTNEVTSHMVTLNGEELTENEDYTVSQSGGEGSWMRYTYTINKALFESEGEYNIVIASTDIAENNAFSDVKNAAISFVVDRTAPLVTITGMESNSNYQNESQTVTLIPTDDGGLINMVIIRTLDRDGNVLEELFNLSGEELLTYLSENGGEIKFILNAGLNQTIQVICEDASFDNNGQANRYEKIFENVSVSASAVELLFSGATIGYVAGGVSVTGAAVGAAFFFIKRRFLKK